MKERSGWFEKDTTEQIPIYCKCCHAKVAAGLSDQLAALLIANFHRPASALS